MPRILLVEDDTNLSATICERLESEQYFVDQQHDGLDALERLRTISFDLLILDWDLPGASGYEICQRYRSNKGSAPVLMLTGKADIDHKEAAFNAGADDYLTKPFSSRELVVRIKALLRRTTTIAPALLQSGELSLDNASFCLHKNEQTVQLTAKEFAVMELFMKQPSHVFSAEALLDRLWDKDAEVSVFSVRTCIKNLRKKLDSIGESSCIQNLHGLGYKFELHQ